MNENAKRWIAELKSGKWQQGRRRLHDTRNDTYCCLGVACEMYHREVEPIRVAGHDGEDCSFYAGKNAYPPDVVVSWLGLKVASTIVEEIARMNDVCLMSFAQIAEELESPVGAFYFQE